MARSTAYVLKAFPRGDPGVVPLASTAGFLSRPLAAACAGPHGQVLAPSRLC